MNIKDMILDGHETEKEEKEITQYIFDSSMASKTMLQNYLTILYPEKEKTTEINDEVIEKLMIDGIHQELACHYTDDKLKRYEKYECELNKNWLLTTTIDTVTIKENTFDNILYLKIHENKLAYNFTVQKFIEDFNNHAYTKELQLSKFILRRNYENSVFQKTQLNFFIKDIKNTDNKESYLYFHIPLMDKQQIKKTYKIITTDLQHCIESGTIPNVCDDLWMRTDKQTGRDIPTKCSHYCEHGKSGNCPYYDNVTKTITIEKKDTIKHELDDILDELDKL